MPFLSTSTLVLTIGIILLLAPPAHAFGAGNIAAMAKIEGQNWRHGDIEDTLLNLVMSRAAGGKKFDKMNVARVYFGNWLRDYSQAIDVGTVKYVSAEAIRILLWVLGFMTFGYGTKEFEVTAERLGCYRPEDHIDNPKDYADNIDATQYDRRLRGPVDERVELAIDPQTGLKNYIANERAGIMTSAKHVRHLFSESIRLGRAYARNNNEADLHESLRLMGTGLHCLEDYSAHSNYTELALIEMGERDVFPHVGRRTQIRLQGARNEVYPVVTGTFGGVDFLHSVCGEIGDKATQSEIEELEGTMQNEGNKANTSMLKELLDSIPSEIFGGKDEAGKADELQQNATTAQMNQVRVSPREPEEFTRQMQEYAKEIYPIIQWHDEVLQSITETIEKIPILPDLIENVENQINVFVFSLLAPFVMPLISQIKTELNEGSSEVIASSKEKQLIVFDDDNCSDPTHSMLAKDHFSNILNEPAGRIASQVLKWVVPQITEAIDNESVDVDRTIDRIIDGVLHHPALRTQGEDGAADGRRLMFGVVESWWNEQSDREKQGLRRQLSREGVENGENHKEGVHDTGHGCGHPLTMAKKSAAGESSGAAALMGGLQEALSGQQGGHGGSSSSSGHGQGGFGGGRSRHEDAIGKFASQAAGGGTMGGIVGALAGGLGGSLLSGAFGGDDKSEKKVYESQGYNSEGNFQESYTETAHSGNRYGQAEVTETRLPGGGRETEYQRYEQQGGQGAGFEQRTETRPNYGGGYEQTNERRYEHSGGRVETESWQQGQTSDGRTYGEEPRRHERRNSNENDSDDSYKKKQKHKKKHHGNDSDDDDKPKHSSRRNEHGGGNEYGGGGNEAGRGSERREENGYREGRNEYGGGRNEGAYSAPPPRNEYGGGNEYGSEPPRDGFGGGFGGESREEGEFGGGRTEMPGSFGGGGFGQQEGSYGGGRENERGFGGGRRDDEDEDGGRRRDDEENNEYGRRKERREW